MKKTLTSIRAVLALLVTITSCILAWYGKISGEQFLALATIALTFYFTRDRNIPIDSQNDKNGDRAI